MPWNGSKEKRLRFETYKSLRHVLLDSNSEGSWRSTENTDGTFVVGESNVLFRCRRGRFSEVDVGVEKGEDEVEEVEKEYLLFPAP